MVSNYHLATKINLVEGEADETGFLQPTATNKWIHRGVRLFAGGR